MTVGDTARAGDPGTVLDAGSTLQGRTVGTDAYNSLLSAERSLGAPSGSALSIERMRSLIQGASGPANLVQIADQAWAADVSDFGWKMEDIERRAITARSDFDEANRDASSAKQKLNDFDSLNADIESGSNRLALALASRDAKDHLAGVTQRLKNLDDERLSLDSSAASFISEQRDQYVSARNAMPNPPTISAGVRVSAQMPDGTTVEISAVDLAQLKDPATIGGIWAALPPAERQRLITDSPLLIGNLDGIALRDRNTANVITAKEYRDELGKRIEMVTLLKEQYAVDGLGVPKISDLRGEIKSLDAILGDRREGDPEWLGRYLVFDENGRGSIQSGAVLVGFNPLRDSVITFQGALDPTTGNIPSWMEQVGVVVPGTNSNLASFTGDLDRGKDLYAKSGKRSGYFTWHGAPMPQFAPPEHFAEAGERGFADTAAPRLASFTNSLELPEDTDLVPIAHSYGAVVLGTAELLGLKADRIVYVAPAGLGHEVTGIADFPNTKDKPHFVLQARNDIVVGWNAGKSAGDLGHGPVNPLDTPRVTRLETGYLDVEHPGAGTIESPGWIDTHSTPFTRDSTSLRNITDAVTGENVSLYHPNDRELVQSGFHPVWVEFPDSGAGKPVEEISSSDLSKVK